MTTADLRGARVPLLAGTPSRLWHETVTTRVLGYRTGGDGCLDRAADHGSPPKRTGADPEHHRAAVHVQGWQPWARRTVDADALAQIGALQWSEVVSRPVAARVDRPAPSGPWSRLRGCRP